MARLSVEQPPPPTAHHRHARAGSSLRRFFKSAALFVAGFVILALVIDASLAARARKSNGKRLVGGRDVYPAVQAAHRPDPSVHTLYLGDSVARQLFAPGSEGDPQTRYLTSNQAISLAGHYFLLRDALDNFPAARQVYFLYAPSSWANDLDQVWTHDYFCGYFHSPAQVAETFRVTGDVELLAAHLARCAIPNILAYNSTSNALPPTLLAPDAAAAPIAQYSAAPTSPLFQPLSELRARHRREKDLRFIGPTDDAPRPLAVSHVSDHFLARMKDLCASRGVRLTILPCPCPRSDQGAFAGEREIYGGAHVLYYDRSLFRPDGVHFLDSFVPQARRDLIQAYHLGMP
jgi:hypothetical protein